MDLYVCSTYYHVLITLLKTHSSMNRNVNISILLLDTINDTKRLSALMTGTTIFKSIEVLDAPDYVYHKNIINKLFWKSIGTKKLDSDLSNNFSTYNNIYLYMDDTWLADYFKCKDIKYHLIEDSIDGYKHILNNRYARLADPSKNGWLNMLYKFFPNAEGNYKFLLDCDQVIDIEVNEIEGTIFKETDRLVEVPRKPLFDQLDDKDFLNTVLEVFLDDRNIINGENIAIVFTSPFFDDKLVDSEDSQLALYKKLISRYSDNNILFKAHPRDVVDYTKLNNVKVIPKNFPSELIAYLDQSKISKFISIASHSVDIYPKDKIDFYELDEVKQWK